VDFAGDVLQPFVAGFSVFGTGGTVDPCPHQLMPMDFASSDPVSSKFSQMTSVRGGFLEDT
jgi:hypothetical protein